MLIKCLECLGNCYHCECVDLVFFQPWREPQNIEIALTPATLTISAKVFRSVNSKSTLLKVFCTYINMQCGNRLDIEFVSLVQEVCRCEDGKISIRLFLEVSSATQ